jgi:phage terminase Nu1 subunit (DNA packaging protein)
MVASARRRSIFHGSWLQYRPSTAASFCRRARVTPHRPRGELVEAAAVEAERSGVLRTVRAGMLAVPSRAAQRLPHLTAHDMGVIDGEIRDALAEIGGN